MVLLVEGDLFPALYFWFVFFFNDTATTEIYTLSLHDALPISYSPSTPVMSAWAVRNVVLPAPVPFRSEEHTSELQSQSNLVCRLLLEKKKKAGTLCDHCHPHPSLDASPSNKPLPPLHPLRCHL